MTGPRSTTNTAPRPSYELQLQSSSPALVFTNATNLEGTALLTALQPVRQVTSGRDGWTTLPGFDGALPLTDTTFRPTSMMAALKHEYVAAPDGTLSMKATYPEGSYTFGHKPQGGFSFYSPGPSAVDLTTAKEATLGYSVYFASNFQFNKGGKLPGFYGGDNAQTALACSGGRRSTTCFSLRFMWRKEGRGELYTYLPQHSANDVLCKVPPKSICNDDYGTSVGRGAFNFTVGAWNHISERIRLNDAGQANGEIQLFFNGVSVVNVGGLVLRDNAAGRIWGIQMQTFFGGSFKSPVTTEAYFSHFSVAITKKLSESES
ncbi:polysaccharide lyase family 14 protein [Athelia psychrophila]|uniref:Polysaccharide lyase family 14 protein n=1 Tax=Athelia psychrophila TaxID=1759441 RepID=A0A166VNS6_9AGAM|nr:polysaccharide lyase family 14 protein [Fibularhizoctonia sp. CBS 109695]